jgi:hypothetical protein
MFGNKALTGARERLLRLLPARMLDAVVAKQLGFIKP